MSTELSITQNKLMIGIDGGGSKTEFCLFSEDGCIIRRIRLGGTNPNVYSLDTVLDILKTGIDLLLKNHPNVTAIFAGIAGCGNRQNAEQVLNFLKGQYPKQQIEVNGDSINSVYSTQYYNSCVVAIVGTGSVIFVKDNDRLTRIGGWGYLIDRGYNGFYLGTEVLRAVMADEDGIGDTTSLTKRIQAELCGRAVDNFSVIYKKSNEEIAAFTRLLFEAYDEGDSVALSIIKNNVAMLSQRLCDVGKKHPDCTQKIVITGGLANRKDVLLKFLEIPDGAELVFPDLPPIYGACHYCSIKFGNPPANFHKNFKTDYEEKK